MGLENCANLLNEEAGLDDPLPSEILGFSVWV